MILTGSKAMKKMKLSRLIDVKVRKGPVYLHTAVVIQHHHYKLSTNKKQTKKIKMIPQTPGHKYCSERLPPTELVKPPAWFRSNDRPENNHHNWFLYNYHTQKLGLSVKLKKTHTCRNHEPVSNRDGKSHEPSKQPEEMGTLSPSHIAFISCSQSHKKASTLVLHFCASDSKH